MSLNTDNFVTRKTSFLLENKFLLGKIGDGISERQLPTHRDVLKYILYKKHSYLQISKQYPQLYSIVCCPLKTGLKEASCDSPGGCVGSSMCPSNVVEKCGVMSVKLPWVKAWLPIISDFGIR